MEEVILVDKKGNQTGIAEKIAAHEQGLLHRAFSIVIYNDHKEIMLQLRAKSKYHSGGLWTNTCCSHPRPNEGTSDAAHRRLQEEMGFSTNITEIGTLIYKVPFPNGMTEHEFLHLFVGKYNDEPQPVPEEADDWKWMSIDDLRKDMKNNPANYTYWFKRQADIVLDHIQKC